MNIVIRQYTPADAGEVTAIWNQVVEEGNAFPQEEPLTQAEGNIFFIGQSYTGVAEDTDSGKILGMYILHPNNVGRCGHIANASYAVDSAARGLHIGEKLVRDCLEQGARHGFSILQFNAVVDSNIHARHLYERLGFHEVGRIAKGFRMKDGHFEDIHVMYREL